MYFFFFSYARVDASPYLKQFYEDLSAEVRNLAGVRADHPGVGFFDEEISVGDVWADAAINALRSSKTFVCILSRGYLNSGFAGRELEMFRRRLTPLPTPKSEQPHPLILPVCWDSPARLPQLQPALANFQLATYDRKSPYGQEGLYYLTRLNRHRDDYYEFVHRFAQTVLENGRDFGHLLTEGRWPPHLSELPSAFEARSPTQDIEEPQPAGGGPRVAKFVFVAGSRHELGRVRAAGVSHYGERGGMEWVAYPAAEPTPVGLHAQLCATSEGYLYESLPLDKQLVQRVREAEARNELVILIVDPWTLLIETYARWASEFDRYDFINCAVLVVWGDDEETAKNRPMLEDVVRMNFVRKLLVKAPYFRQAASPESLRKELSVALSKLRRRISERAVVYRQVEWNDDFPKSRVI